MADSSHGAVDLAKKTGWRLFPVHSISRGACTCHKREACFDPAKHPRVTGWNKPDDADTGTLERWAAKWPNCNWGVATELSGLVVIDTDPRNGGSDSEAAIEHELPTTPTVRTGGGGTHRYHAAPTDVRVTSGSHKVGHGIDVKGRGGYVVAPPSLHMSGRRYEWAPGLSPWDVDVAPLPAWLTTSHGPTRLLTFTATRRPRRHRRP